MLAAKNTVIRLIEADNQSDINTVLSCYADSIEFYPVGNLSVSGLQKIRKNYEDLFKDYKLSITTTIIDAKVFENDAYIKGLNAGTKMKLLDSTVQHLHDYYIALLVKNAAGEWKITKLIWGFR